MASEDQDLYSDGGATDAAAPEQREADGATTGLLAKDFFQGKDPKPGDKCEVEVVKVYDDQVEVRYSRKSDDDEEASVVEEELESPSGDSEMIALMD